MTYLTTLSAAILHSVVDTEWERMRVEVILAELELIAASAWQDQAKTWETAVKAGRGFDLDNLTNKKDYNNHCTARFDTNAFKNTAQR